MRAPRALKAALVSGAAASITATTVLASGAVASASGHTVQPGETLWSITQGNWAMIDNIASMNGLSDPNLVMIGQLLQLPGSGSGLAATPDSDGDSDGDSAAAPAAATTTAASSGSVVPQSAFEACVIQRESGGNPTAVNPSSGAAGLYQFLPSTWAGFDGYATASLAPASVQQQYFDIVFAAQGTAPWAPYDGC